MRASAVEGLADADQTVLGALARDDDSPRVRRAALARLLDVDIIGGLAQRDPDTQVRADAGARLVALACAASDADRAALAGAAVTDDRLLAQIARTAPVAAVALSALDRLRETRGLATIARHAEHADVRLRALERLHEPAELSAVAANTDYKDVGLAAVERLTDSATLNDIADRAKNKAVGKRARGIVREVEVREAEARAAADARSRRQALLRDAVDGVERLKDTSRGRAELDWLATEWDQTGPADAEATGRFQGAVDRVRAHFDRLDRDAAAEAAALAAHAEARRTRETLIDAAQSLDGPDTGARLDELRVRWTALPPLDEPETTALTRRFDAAAARLLERVQARARAEAMQGEISQLIAEATSIVDEGDLETGRPRFQDVQRRWKTTVAHLALDRAQDQAFHAAEQRWKAREDAVRAEMARTAEEQRARLADLAARADALAQRPDASIKELEHVVREIRTALDHAPVLPGDQRDAVPGRLKALLTTLLPRLREQRETDDWRRWANAGIQEELVKRVESLRTVTDLFDAGRQLKDLRRQWKAVSAGPRDDGDALWQRFKVAADEIQARCDEHFGRVAAEQAENLARRQALCEQAEALAQSTDWIATADTLKRLQGDWVRIGPAPREVAGELARRFRVACDTFFTRRKTDLTERKHVWAANAQKKEALCARAEAIAESSDWVAAFTEIKQLQAEWKTAGPVRKNRSEILWKRFRTACDHFFERYGKRHEITQQHRVSDRESLVQAMEALTATPGSTQESDASVAAESSALAPEDPSAEGVPEPAIPEDRSAEGVTEPAIPASIAADVEPSVSAGPDPAALAPAAEAPAPPTAPPPAPAGLLDTVEGLWRRWHDAPGVAPEIFAPLRARFDAALDRVLTVFPEVFTGTRFDSRRRHGASRSAVPRGRSRGQGGLARAGDRRLLRCRPRRAAEGVARGEHHRRACQRRCADPRRRRARAARAERVARPRAAARRGRPGARRAVPSGLSPVLRRASGPASPARRAARRTSRRAPAAAVAIARARATFGRRAGAAALLTRRTIAPRAA